MNVNEALADAEEFEMQKLFALLIEPSYLGQEYNKVK